MDTTKRFPGLDGLRAVFCVGIVLYHVNGSFGSVFSGWLGPVYAFGGYFGNYIFFILSGLLTALHYKEPILGGGCRFFSFMKKRLFRLYPLYLLSNLAAMLFPGTALTLPKTAATFLLLAFGGTDGSASPYNHPAWFLCVLTVCYFLYWLAGALSRLRPRLYLFLCVFFIICGMALMKRPADFPFLYQTCGEGYLNFFLGALLAEAAASPAVSRRLISAAGFAAFSGTALAAACLGLTNLPGDMRWGITVLCAGLVSMALYAAPLIKLLSFPPLQLIGSCSFSVYLWHVPLVRWFLLLESKLGLVITDQRPNLLLYLALLLELSLASRRCQKK